LKLDKPPFPQLFKGIALFTPGGDLIYGIDPSKQSHWHMYLCAGLQEIFGLPEPPHFLVPGYTATIDRWLDHRTQRLQISAEIYRPVLHHQALLSAVFGIGNPVWSVAPWQEGSCDPIVLETYRHQFPQLWEDHDLIVRFERSPSFSYSVEESYATLLHRERESLRGMEIPIAGERLFPTLPLGGKGSPTEHSGHFTAGSNAESFTHEDGTLDSLHVGEAALQDLPPDLHAPNATESASASQLTPSPNDPEEILSPQSYSHSPHAQGYVLRLFVSGNSAATEQTLKSLHELLEHSLGHPYTLKVIDIFNHPEQAEVNQISATPTLLRVWPPPVRRIVGDLNDIEKVLRILAVPDL
jgi:circadian clock protein KaiB